MMQDDDRIRALRELLLKARSRLDPHDFGIVRRRRRRLAGLRRDEVAELTGMSEVWYARFETGRGRISLAALGRVASVLQMDTGERNRLYRLARPELQTISTGALEDSLSGLGSCATNLRDLAQTCRSASSLHDIAACATAAAEPLVPSGLAYWQRVDPKTHDLPFVSVHGRKADPLVGYVQPAGTVNHILPALEAGNGVTESNIAASPSREIRERIEKVDVRAYASVPLLDESGFAHGIGIAWSEPHDVTPLEWFVLRTIAAVADVALHGSEMTP